MTEGEGRRQHTGTSDHKLQGKLERHRCAEHRTTLGITFTEVAHELLGIKSEDSIMANMLLRKPLNRLAMRPTKRRDQQPGASAIRRKCTALQLDLLPQTHHAAIAEPTHVNQPREQHAMCALDDVLKFASVFAIVGDVELLSRHSGTRRQSAGVLGRQRVCSLAVAVVCNCSPHHSDHCFDQCGFCGER